MEISASSSSSTTTTTTSTATLHPLPLSPHHPPLSRYESQKLRDWNTFGQYLRNHRPPLTLSRCSGAHVLEFLRYLDQFGKTKVHSIACPFFGQPNPPSPCPCPLRQAWGSLDALIGRLRAAYDEHGGAAPETNPFAARAVRLYLRQVRELQSKARGVCYDKKKRSGSKQQHSHISVVVVVVVVVRRKWSGSCVSSSTPWGKASSLIHGNNKGFFSLEGVGPSKSPSRSFKDVLSRNSLAGDTLPNITQSVLNGVPAMLLSDEDVRKPASPF
ncbi:hypothetical protein IEQ34_018435 [Dendrobium chrysotoxum]|uniref:ALOG domain-containing protein n=1 Tax=Dendrobium chrysotoxum TaxID=161865 RepID=A0AAV7G440_DENCH|nr:hypothetical protein IEQ34_018435 [Dendrobium chrysotoxum]